MASPEKYGNNLLLPVVQPGWTIESDGFGMLQSTVKFKWAKSEIEKFPSVFFRGSDHPVPDYQQLKLFKATMTENKGEVVDVVAEYCGLSMNGGGAPGVNYDARGYSDPQVMMTGAASAESIQSHPNFVRVNILNFGDVGGPLAGPPPPGGGFDDNPLTNPNRALWTPKVAGGGIVNNYQFIGFLPNQSVDDIGRSNIKAGIKSYYKPQNTLRVLIYFNSEQEALDRASIVGFVTNGDAFKLTDAYKKFATGGYAGEFNYTPEWDEFINKSFLVSGTSVERFGSLWKVTADLMLSGMGGWDREIYPLSAYG
jgi:hypothetical protein